MFDALEIAVVAFDRDGRVVTANRRARTEFALMGESIDRNGVPVEPVQYIDEHGQVLRRRDIPSVHTLRTGEVVRDFLMGVRMPEGPVLWAMVATSPMRDPENGSITGVVCTFEEVTEQR